MKQRRLLSFLPISCLVLLVSVAAAQSADGGAELNLGVQAYRNAQYDEAIQHFEKAVTLGPANAIVHLYLATAYAQRYIPGADMPGNIKLAQRAIEQYRRVIEIDSSKGGTIDAVKGIAYLDLQMKKFDESKDYYRRATELDPQDAEAFYAIGVIDWTETYTARQEERAKLGMRPDASLPARSKKVCAMLKEKNSPNIQDGIDNLNKALELRPDYDDAMAYLNLMYRERSDVQCDDTSAREADLKTADDWVDKTIAVKKSKAEKERGAPAPQP
jgi:tetratricopeptide (TPR) repeat protein